MTGRPIFASLAAAAALIAMPALAQEATEDELERAGQAADIMRGELYMQQPTAGVSPAEVIAKLQELGYTDFHDFDVEWDEYEVEATSPAGEDVEIEIDAATGRIKEIERNFF